MERWVHKAIKGPPEPKAQLETLDLLAPMAQLVKWAFRVMCVVFMRESVLCVDGVLLLHR